MPVHSPQVMQFFSRGFAARRCARADRVWLTPWRKAPCRACRMRCRAFAKPRSADPDRGGVARNARQERGGDLRRQCEGRAGRHHHDLENAGGVLRFRPDARAAAARRCRRDRNPGRCKSATPGPGGSSSIRRLEAKGSVVVTQKDQVVTGETAIFDTAGQPHHHGGRVNGVVLTQCKNVLQRRPPAWWT